jgi:hypothetical protein
VVVLAITWNCADTARYFLRHYETIADEIAIFDDFSTDGTREIFQAHPKVLLRDWPHPGSGINEDMFLNFLYSIYPTAAKHGFDWVIVADPDEFLYAPNPLAVLERALIDGVEVIQTAGYNMMGEGLPKDDGRQIYEINPMGVRAPVYSKPVIFRPTARVRWIRGRHALEDYVSPVLSNGPLFKLLHYRYLGANYTAAKNAKNYARCGLDSGDKGAAWSCSPGYNGVDKEHSPLWAESAKKLAFNVLEV